MASDSATILPDNKEPNEFWIKRWNANKATFHKSEVHSNLVKYESLMLPTTGAIFFPLCGKCVDMRYLSDRGHRVVGVELSELAISQFFSENSLSYEVSKSANFDVYKSTSGDLTIFRGDLFEANSAMLGKFDAIWDRGSLVAINTKDQRKYADLIFGILKPDGKYLVNSIEYDATKFGGPPHALFKSDIEQLFGHKFDSKLLEHFDFVSDHLQEMGVTDLYCALYLLTNKTTQ